MDESSVYSLAPELKGIDPQRIWDSEVTSGYPKVFMLGKTIVSLGAGVKDQEYLGEYLEKLDLVPKTGPILDLGAGSCSDLIFGDLATKERVWGIDYAEAQLGRSKIREYRQVVADLRKDGWVNKLRGQKFVLATSFLLAKYLTINEAGNLYSQVRTVAQRLVVAEYRSVNKMFEELLGQRRNFEQEEEKYLLEEAGWQNVQTKILKIKDGAGASFLGVVWGEAPAE